MRKRIGIAALVGAITFVCTFVEMTIIYSHWAVFRYPHSDSMAHVAALLYAVLFGAINAAVTFGVSFALPKW